MLHQSHDPVLVTVSVAIAMMASYTALDLASRVRTAETSSTSAAWLLAAAFTMGGGIWAMHFVAMLAMNIAGMDLSYDVTLTLASLALAIGVTGLGLALASRRLGGLPGLIAAAITMGAGIAGMHYTGMAAIRGAVRFSYDNGWVSVSVLIAIVASMAALWLAFARTGLWQRIAAAIVMGFAISGMHFAGMAAARHSMLGTDAAAMPAGGFGQVELATGVSAATFLVLFIALAAAMIDRRLALIAAKETDAIKRSEERFRALYRKTPLPLMALDADGKVQEASDVLLTLIGYAPNEAQGRSFDELMTTESAGRWQTADWPAILADTFDGAEYQLTAKDGRLIDVAVTAHLERDPAGEMLIAVLGLDDVTERKRTEAALRQAQKMEALGQLTGGIAHDFNNLLAVIVGNLEMLRRHVEDSPRAVQQVENAMQGARRGAGLTQRMLSFARQQQLKPQAIDLPALVRSMQDLITRPLGAQVHIETRFPLGRLAAMADANQVELALLNLVVNARDAMPKGGTITISAAARHLQDNEMEALDAGDYVILTVSDDGEGMDAETLARAREPFFTTKPVDKGSGLGLSMVHGFAEQSGGALVLSSAPGRGTTAEIWLPAAEVEEAAEPQPAEAPSPAGVLRVLAVDDDALVLMNTVAMLEDLGHTVESVYAGAKALEMFERDPGFDLLVTDQAMPGMTGLQLAARIRESRPDLPILLVTGYSDLPDLEGGNFLRLGKPFSQHELADALARLTAGRQGANIVSFASRSAEL